MPSSLPVREDLVVASESELMPVKKTHKDKPLMHSSGLKPMLNQKPKKLKPLSNPMLIISGIFSSQPTTHPATKLISSLTALPICCTSTAWKTDDNTIICIPNASSVSLSDR